MTQLLFFFRILLLKQHLLHIMNTLLLCVVAMPARKAGNGSE